MPSALLSSPEMGPRSPIILTRSTLLSSELTDLPYSLLCARARDAPSLVCPCPNLTVSCSPDSKPVNSALPLPLPLPQDLQGFCPQDLGVDAVTDGTRATSGSLTKSSVSPSSKYWDWGACILESVHPLWPGELWGCGREMGERFLGTLRGTGRRS